MEYILSQRILKDHCGPLSYVRGLAYFNQARVYSIRGVGNRILGLVQGSRRSPYEVEINLIEKGIKNSVCACMQHGNCKHVVALGLSMIDNFLHDIEKTLSIGDENGEAIMGEYKEVAKADLWKRDMGNILGNQIKDVVGKVDDKPAMRVELLFRTMGNLKIGSRNKDTFNQPIEIRPRVCYPSGVCSLTDITWSNILDNYSHKSKELPRQGFFFLKNIARVLGGSSGPYSYYRLQNWERIDTDDDADFFWQYLKDYKQFGISLRSGKKGDDTVEISSDPISDVLIVNDAKEDFTINKKFIQSKEGGQEEEILQSRVVLFGDPPIFVAVSKGDNFDVPYQQFSLHPFAGGKAKKIHMNRDELVIPSTGRVELEKNYLPVLMRSHEIRNKSEKIILPVYLHPKILVEISSSRKQEKKKTKNQENKKTKNQENKKIVQGIIIHLSFDYGGIKIPFFHTDESIKINDQTVVTSRNEETTLIDIIGSMFMYCNGAWKDTSKEINENYSREAPTLNEVFMLKEIDAAQFMVIIVPRLKENENIIVREDTNLPQFILDTSAPTIAFSVNEKNNDRDWFDLGIAVSVGGEEVPFALLFSALSGDEQHLLLPSGRFFPINHKTFDELRRLIKEAKGVSEITKDGITINRFQAGFWKELQELGVIAKQSIEWQKQISLLHNVAEVPLVEPPCSLNATLRDYQKIGFSWLKFLYENELGGVLGDDMGLGKTIQAIALLIHATEEEGKKTKNQKNKKSKKQENIEPQNHRPCLVIAPTSVVENWATELERFSPVLNRVVLRRGDRKEDFKKMKDADVIVTSYSLLVRDFEELSKIYFNLVILDEAQFVKNHQSKAYAFIRKLKATRRIALTGTPMENNVMELWSVFSIVAPGLFGSPEHFRDNFQKPIERQSSIEHVKRLKSRIRPFFMRRTKELVAIDLPPKTEQILFLEMDPKHKQLYDLHLQRERQKVLGLLAETDGMRKNRFQVLQSLTKMRQLALHPGLLGEEHKKISSTKLDSLLDQVQTLIAGGHRALVFSQFTSFLAHVKILFSENNIEFNYLDGSTINRAAEIKNFQSDNGHKVFLISLKAGGIGLNLTNADYCIILDPWWNPAVESQAAARAHRIGQTKSVFVYKMITKNTIEEKVLKLQEKKKALFDNIIEDSAAFGSLITEKDIRGLFE